MSWTLCFLLLLQRVLGSQELSDPQVTADNEASQCKTIYTFGYGYHQFFHLAPNFNQEDGSLINLKFKVKARSDAHILLSSTALPEDTDPVYEIVIGAGRNSFSDIRRRFRAESKTRVFTNNTLSGIELKAFWIKISADGIIQVGIEGQDLPFMEWQDPDPLDIQYFSFSTWSGVAGKWLYDCGVSNNDIGSIAVQQFQTTVDRLRAGLLTNYDVHSRPVKNSSQLIPITIQLQANYVDINMKSSFMTVGSTLTMIWNDEKMVWDPQNFENLTSLSLVHHEIWKPQLIHLNSVGKEKSPFNRARLEVSFSGQVTWRPHAMLNSHCHLDLRSWPWDIQTCHVKLGFVNQPDNLQVLVNNNTLLANVNTAWQVLKLEAEAVPVNNPWTLDLPLGSDDLIYSSGAKFTFTLKRTTQEYLFTLIIPLAVIVVISLCCFWMDPLGKEKLATNCLLLVLLCGFFMRLDYSLPHGDCHIPYLFKVYSWVMIVVCVATLITGFITNLNVRSPFTAKAPPKTLISFLSKPAIRSLFLLPQQRTDNLISHEQQGEEESEGSHCLWQELAVLCDRGVFVTALVAYTAIFLW